MLREIEYELETLSTLGGSVITQPGQFILDIDGIKACVESLDRLCFKKDQFLVLENSASNRLHTIGKTFQGLHDIVERTQNKQYIGIGINVNHFHMNGLYDMTTIEGIETLFRDYDAHFKDPPTVMIMDSLFEDGIWTNMDALFFMIAKCSQLEIPIITSSRINVDIIREILRFKDS